MSAIAPLPGFEAVDSPAARPPRGYQAHGRREGRTCSICGRRVWVELSRAKAWRYCSRRCATVAQTRLRPYPGIPLQQRCMEWMASQRSNFNALARLVGVRPTSLRKWFKDGGTLKRSTLAQLAEVLGISLETAIAEAGGITDTEARAAIGKAAAARNFPHDTESRRPIAQKAGATRRGRPMPRQVIEKGTATRKATGSFDRALGLAIDASRSPRGRIMHALYGHLLHNRTPTTAEQHHWAKATGDRFGVSARQVEAIWRPYLQARGLRRVAGRKPLAARRNMIDDLMAPWPRKGDGDMADGFWPEAARLVSTMEGRQIDYAALKRWYYGQAAGERITDFGGK